MEENEINLNNPIVQLEKTRERLRNVEAKSSEQAESLKNANVRIEQLEAKLQKATEDSYVMQITLEVTKRELNHAQQALSQGTQKTKQEERQTKRRKLIAEGLSLVALVLIGIGASELGSTPPNSLGLTWIVLGSFVYIGAAMLITLFA